MSSENEMIEPEITEQPPAEEPARMEAPSGEPEPVVEPAAAEQSAQEKPAVSSSQPDKPKQKQTAPRSRSKLKVKDVIAYFAACGRCGFFLTGYRAAYGQESLETAVAKAKGGWLTFTWGIELRELILLNYGSRIEAADFHFDGCCPECRRSFTYHASRSPRRPDRLRIEIKPRKRS
jgi:hypothetical protein